MNRPDPPLLNSTMLMIIRVFVYIFCAPCAHLLSDRKYILYLPDAQARVRSNVLTRRASEGPIK